VNELEEDRQQNSFEGFASQALRLQRKGSFEQLLAQHLIQSVSMDPLNKVRLVLEAAFMVPSDKLDIDFELAESVYLTALGFLNTNIQSEFVSMAWGFTLTQENYDRFIGPWHKNIPLNFASYCQSETNDKRKVLAEAEDEFERFFLFTHDLNLAPTSFQALKSEFLRWSIPVTMTIFEKLSRLIDPDLYREMLQILRPEARRE
jgi:hypothetical protein